MNPPQITTGHQRDNSNEKGLSKVNSLFIAMATYTKDACMGVLEAGAFVQNIL